MSKNYDDVDELPGVAISAPPPVLDGSGKVWHLGGGVKAETSFIYGVLATFAGRKGGWTIASAQELWNIAGEESDWRTFRQNMLPILGQHHRAGLIQMVRHLARLYVVPTQALLDHINRATGDRPFS